MVISTKFDIYTRTDGKISSCLTLAALSSGQLSLMDIKFMKCRFELTYLKTIRAKVVMFGIKPKLMKCRFQLTYFYDLLTYLTHH
jgi:hypothetical protein